MKRTTIYNITSLLLILAVALSCKDKSQEHEANVVGIIIGKPLKKKYSFPIHASGRLFPEHELKLSFKTGGLIKYIWVKEGQFVKKGTLLAQLDLQEIKAYNQQARLGLDKAQRDYERARNLYNDSVATLEQLQNAHTALKAAKSNLDITSFNLSQSLIKAPSDGWILKKLSNENEIIGPGYPAFFFGEKGEQWKMKMAVADKEILKIHMGDSASVSFSAYPDMTFKAHVSEIGSYADPYTGTFEVDLKLIPTQYKLSTGFIGNCQIFPSAQKELFFILPSALTNTSGSKATIHEYKDGKAIKHRVHIAGMLENYILVDKGINESMDIIIKGSSYIRKNSSLKVQTHK
ncbi:MAG: efflux RND transporter periplasmic adaptor subunit [Hyphomicrobiales bacterium]